MRTPWGKSQDKKEYAKGITFYSTPSHGGFRVHAKQNQEIPELFRNKDGWYEEDCEWAMVCYTFPELFSPEKYLSAINIIKNYSPHLYMKVTGVVLTPEESYQLREEKYHQDNKENYLPLAAIGDHKEGVPKGMVLVFAGKGGRLCNGSYPQDVKYFLVPDTEYTTRFFVVDTSKHLETDLRF